ncbi:hypothetical protein [Kutzneria chonburiensis]|uniref:Uncharacterized protein n=1 Tax=Kutzneria chonburiensis TaxID=1483604 RepID=A0ABV6N236_9PSEU|nr:hypothetical protein [Kutzneria chonburiensis]
MSTYQKMTGFVVNPRLGIIGGINVRLEIGNAVWDVARPMIEVADNVVISPEAEAVDGDVVFRLNRWQILQLDPLVQLPIVGHTQAAAVTIANDFRADRTISFASGPEALNAWVADYLAARQPSNQR